MQANVPQPSNDDDETDDVDEELKKLQVWTKKITF